MVNPFTVKVGDTVNNVSLIYHKRKKPKYFQDNLPAEPILDQRGKNVREQFTERVTAETSLVFVCYAGK